MFFFATSIDDSLIFSSLLAESSNQRILVVLGILVAAVLELMAIIYFSKKIAKLKYKLQLTALGVAILGLLILLRVI